MRDDGGLVQGGDGRKVVKSRYILKVGLTGFIDGLKVGVRGREESRIWA